MKMRELASLQLSVAGPHGLDYGFEIESIPERPTDPFEVSLPYPKQSVHRLEDLENQVHDNLPAADQVEGILIIHDPADGCLEGADQDI
jgi:hypothetical protein